MEREGSDGRGSGCRWGGCVGGRTWLGIVVPHDLEVLPVPRRPRIRHVYPIERMVPVPVARESNPHRHVDHLWRAAAMPRVRKTRRAFIDL